MYGFTWRVQPYFINFGVCSLSRFLVTPQTPVLRLLYDNIILMAAPALIQPSAKSKGEAVN